MSRWAPASFIINDEMYLINGMSLDPGTFDYMETNWKFAMVPAQALDLEVTSYLGENVICTGDELPITARLTNMGANDFTAGDASALAVEMLIDGEVVLASDWSGTLTTFQSTDFTIGAYTFSGATDFTIQISAIDENADNNALQASVSTSPSATTEWAVELNTDSYGGETGWELRNELGALINFELAGNYQGETSYDFNLSVPSTGCYTFILKDTYGDGMFGSQWGGQNGSCVIRSLDGNGNPTNVLFDYDGSFGFDELPQTIDVTTSLGVNDDTNDEGNDLSFGLRAFPNPFSDVLFISPVGMSLAGSDGNSLQLEVFDLQGRMIFQSTERMTYGASLGLDAADWTAGPVLIRWSTDKESGSFRAIKN